MSSDVPPITPHLETIQLDAILLKVSSSTAFTEHNFNQLARPQQDQFTLHEGKPTVTTQKNRGHHQLTEGLCHSEQVLQSLNAGERGIRVKQRFFLPPED